MTSQGKQSWWLWSLLRPADWFPYLGLVLLGWAGSDAAHPVGALLWSVLYLAGGYGFNGVCDWQTDDPAKNPIRNEAVSPRLAGAVSLVLLLAPVPLSFIWMPQLRWLSAAMVALGVVYSLPGWGLKRFPGVVTLANLALFVPLYWIGAGRMPDPGSADIWVLGILAVPSLQSQLAHELGDEAEDRRSGRNSTAAWLGGKATRALIRVLGPVTGLLAALLWHRGELGAPSAALFLGAGIVSMAGAADDPVKWRRRIKLSYLVPCAAWLMEETLLRFA